MNFNDKVNVGGYVTRIVKDELGNIVSVDSSKNMVLTKGRESLAILISDLSTMTGKRITQMAFGNMGHNPSNPAEPLPTLPEEVNLHNEIYRKALSSYSYPNPTSTTFTARINGSDLVGEIVSEAMLVSSDNTPFSINRFGAMYHSLGLIFEFRWTIYF